VKPTFNQKYEFEYNPKLPALIQVSIFNSNSITSDDLLGTVEVRCVPGQTDICIITTPSQPQTQCKSRHAFVSPT